MRRSSFRRRPSIFKNSGTLWTFTVECQKCPKYTGIFDICQIFLLRFLVTLAKFLDIQNQGKYTRLVLTVKIPVRLKYRESRKAENFRQTQYLSLNKSKQTLQDDEKL